MARTANVPLMREPGHWLRQFEKLQAKGPRLVERHRARVNAREPTAHRGKWHPTSVKRKLQRLRNSMAPRTANIVARAVFLP